MKLLKTQNGSIEFEPSKLYRIPMVRPKVEYNWKPVMSDEDIANSIITIYTVWAGCNEYLYFTSLGYDPEQQLWKFTRRPDNEIVYMSATEAIKASKLEIYEIESEDEITILDKIK